MADQRTLKPTTRILYPVRPCVRPVHTHTLTLDIPARSHGLLLASTRVTSPVLSPSRTGECGTTYK